MTGNRRVDSDAVLRVISASPGDIVNQEKLSKDLEQVYKMGYFDDVVIKKMSWTKGLKLFSLSRKNPASEISHSPKTGFTKTTNWPQWWIPAPDPS